MPSDDSGYGFEERVQLRGSDKAFADLEGRVGQVGKPVKIAGPATTQLASSNPGS